MNDWTVRRLADLKKANLSGFIFKAKSPSCGLEEVPVYDDQGNPTDTGAGIFARAFTALFPQLPVIDERSFQDRQRREIFLRRIRGL
jgi:uncharacterized protein YbbK (DUF523 family)